MEDNKFRIRCGVCEGMTEITSHRYEDEIKVPCSECGAILQFNFSIKIT